jgi:O-antigen/teichoic acid export membrane protein
MLSLAGRPRLALAATQLVCEGSAFLRNLILARLIGAEQMGLAVALALGIRILEMAGELGLDRLLVQVEAVALPATRRAVHLLQLVKGAVLAALAVLLAVPLTRALDPGLDPAVFVLAAASLALRGAVNCDYRERQRDGDFARALVVEGGSNLLGALAAAPLAWFTRDYTALAWASVLQAALMCALSHALATQRMTLGGERAVLARCLRYGLPIALNGALMFLALQGDRLVVAMHFAAADLARFAIAAQLALLPALIGARYVLGAELPRLARLVADPAALRRRENALLLAVGAAAGAGVLLLGVAGNPLVALLYGREFTVAPELFWLLALAAALRLLRAVPNTVLMALERTHLLFLCNLPRLLTVGVALAIAASGAGIGAIVAAGVAGEALGLAAALLFTAAARGPVPAAALRGLPEGA